MRSLRQVAGIVLCLCVFSAAPVGAARGSGRAAHVAAPLIYVGSQKVRVPAIVDRGRVLVPVRGVFEAIHASVEYSPPHFVVVHKDGAVIAGFILDRPHAIIGQRALELDVAPIRRDGRIYVPLRIVAEAAGAVVSYSGRPAIVHIWERRPPDVATLGKHAPVEDAAADEPERASIANWQLGAAIFTGFCLLGCVVIAARRFAPRLAAGPPSRSTQAPREPVAVPEAAQLPDRVAVSTVAASGEARLHKELITEKRTIEVPITREELVIEYAGNGGTVIVEGRTLEPGEVVRIPLWEERVNVDVIKHVILKEDIVIEKRRFPAPLSIDDRVHTAEVGLIEPGPG